MIELHLDKMSNAIAKARRVRNHVRMIAWRRYEVRTPENHVYIVSFDTRDGKHFASCTCAAGAHDQECFHAASAIVLHLAIIGLREKERTQPLQPGVCKPIATRRSILVRRDCNHPTCKTSRCERGQYVMGIAV